MLHQLHLLSYLLTLINPKILTALILAATFTNIVYIVTKTTVTVFNKYHLWKMSANTVMMFWAWIKSILKIEKALAQITKTRSKLKKVEDLT